MSAPRINAATANLMVDAGFGNVANSGKLQIYDGTQPATGGAAITSQVKLLEFTLDSDAFPAAAGGIITANSVGAVGGLANGTAAWFRLVRASSSTHILDGDVGIAGSGADCIISSTAITTLDVFALLSLVIQQPLA